MITVDEWKQLFANNDIDSVNYKDTELEKVTCNGETAWELLKSISISGTAKKGSTLTATIEPSTAKVTYQWYRGDTAISNATNSTYTLTSSDVGYKVHCKASTTSKTVDSNWTDTVDYVWTYQTGYKVLDNTGSITYTWNVGVSWTLSDVRLVYAKCEGYDASGDLNDARIFIGSSQVATARGTNPVTEWKGSQDNVTYVACDFAGTYSVKMVQGWIGYYAHN